MAELVGGGQYRARSRNNRSNPTGRASKPKPKKTKSVTISRTQKGPMSSYSSNTSITRSNTNSQRRKNVKITPSKKKTSSSSGSSSRKRRSSSSGGGGSYKRSATTTKKVTPKKTTATVATKAAVDPKPEEPKEPPPPKFADWLGKDSLYNSQAGTGGTINTELDAYLASLAETNRQFGQDTTDALRNLGWKEGAPPQQENGLARVATAGKGGNAGYWDPKDQLGAYGQAQTNARNDFSGRGLMDSSFYQDAVTNLDNSFNRQRQDYLTAQQNQTNQYNTEKGAANDKAEAARRAAKADALARYNATYNTQVTG